MLLGVEGKTVRMDRGDLGGSPEGAVFLLGGREYCPTEIDWTDGEHVAWSALQETYRAIFALQLQGHKFWQDSSEARRMRRLIQGYAMLTAITPTFMTGLPC